MVYDYYFFTTMIIILLVWNVYNLKLFLINYLEYCKQLSYFENKNKICIFLNKLKFVKL